MYIDKKIFMYHMKIVYKGEKELKSDLQHIELTHCLLGMRLYSRFYSVSGAALEVSGFTKSFASIHAFVAEDFVIKILLCLSTNDIQLD